MASFNPMQALSSGAPPTNDALGLNGGGQPMGLEGFDQDLNFDESLLDSVNGLPTLPFTPSYDFDTFSTTFEDPFSYPGMRVYDGVVNDSETHNGDEPSPQELDNKLLGFGAPLIKAGLVCDGSLGAGQYAELGMVGELYGMFFVAEDVFGSENNPSRPLELTCYRRNLWQCTGQVTLPRHLVAVVNEQGRQVPIFDLAASITAIESIEGKPTEIISIPWKSSGGGGGGSANASLGSGAGSGGAGEDAKVASAPPTLPIDLTTGQELEGNRVSVPVSWKRLQFKHATANNGRRKGLQQHYVVQINLLGRAKGGGEVIKIAEIQSGPVIVRGRSPRNFDSRKDVPLTGDKRLERRGTDASASSSSAAAAASLVAHPGIKTEKGDLAQNIQRYHSLGNIQSGDWSTPQAVFHHQPSPHPSKKLALSPNPTRPPIPPWSSDVASSMAGPSHHAPATPAMGSGKSSRSAAAAPTLPINLSLSEDERSPRRPGSDPLQSPRSSRTIPAQQTAQGAAAVETADMLYEYFPLSIDDWMPPVDAIYRPHVVHHTIIPPEVQAQKIRSKTKRYFAAD